MALSRLHTVLQPRVAPWRQRQASQFCLGNLMHVVPTVERQRKRRSLEYSRSLRWIRTNRTYFNHTRVNNNPSYDIVVHAPTLGPNVDHGARRYQSPFSTWLVAQTKSWMSRTRELRGSRVVWCNSCQVPVCADSLGCIPGLCYRALHLSEYVYTPWSTVQDPGKRVGYQGKGVWTYWKAVPSARCAAVVVQLNLGGHSYVCHLLILQAWRMSRWHQLPHNLTILAYIRW